MGAQWLSGRVLDSRLRGRGFEPHWRHCVVSLSKNINPSLVLVQPRKTRPFITERLLMGRKESNQINKLPGSCLLILSLPGSTSRTHIESLSKPRDSTSVLEALPGNLYIRRQSPSILFILLRLER